MAASALIHSRHVERRSDCMQESLERMRLSHTWVFQALGLEFMRETSGAKIAETKLQV